MRNDGAVVMGLATDDGDAGDDPPSLDWVELQHAGDAPLALQGWKLAQGSQLQRSCEFTPATASVPPAAFVLVYVSSDQSKLANATKAPPPAGAKGAVIVSCNMALKPSPLALLAPGQAPTATPASRIGPPLPLQLANVSFGLPAAGYSGPARYTYLESPTPGAANTGPRAVGPFILSVSRAVGPQPMPGEDVPVNITVLPNLADVKSVQLVYVIGFGKEQRVDAAPAGTQEGGEAEGVTYRASVPGSVLKAGEMVRWYAVAEDANGAESRFPMGGEDQEAYYGTVVGGAQYEVQAPGVPILEWFSPDVAAATTEAGAPGQVLFFDGELHDSVHARRRGVTALLWPKPKLKFSLPRGASAGFRYDATAPRVAEFGLQSFWFELGERSYMKEPLALAAMAAVGQAAPTSFHVHVRLNGAFYGLFAFVEVIDDTFLKRVGLPTSGPLFKSVSGELSNLRWDLPLQEYHNYWVKANRKDDPEDWKLLQGLAQGLAGGGPLPRSQFVFEYLDLPRVINEMASQTVLNNMDRCTKNFYMYRNPHTLEWVRLPWDLDGALGQDNGLGGHPGDTYCVLACEQWNSPLYCDSEHTQDLERVTPWGTITVPLHDTAAGASTQNQGPAVSKRKLAAFKAPVRAAGLPITKFPKPDGWDNPDRVTINTASPNGAKGTYNHLVDAILDVKLTREMYLRRLRSVADELLAGGKLAQLANETYVRIQPLAVADAKKWNSGIDIEKGFKQITTEFIPIRTDQLLGTLYGPAGTHPLLPQAQPADAAAGIALGRWEAGRPEAPLEQYIQLLNKNAYAVDLSDWRITGGTNYTFPAGTVVPGGSSIFVAASLPAWRARTAPPKGGQGLLVVGPMVPPVRAGSPPPSFSLVTADGKTNHPLSATRKR